MLRAQMCLPRCMCKARIIPCTYTPRVDLLLLRYMHNLPVQLCERTGPPVPHNWGYKASPIIIHGTQAHYCRWCLVGRKGRGVSTSKAWQNCGSRCTVAVNSWDSKGCAATLIIRSKGCAAKLIIRSKGCAATLIIRSKGCVAKLIIRSKGCAAKLIIRSKELGRSTGSPPGPWNFELWQQVQLLP